VKALIEAGADPEISNPEGTPLLNVAIKEKRLDLLKMLLDAGASPDVNIGRMNYTPLRLAVTTRNLEAIRLLIAARANVESPDDQGATALMKALYTASPEMVRMLIAAGADVNAKTKWNQTPLKEMIRWAGQSRDKEANVATLRLLRQCGATEAGERLALVEAAAAGNVGRISALLRSQGRGERERALVAAAATRQTAAARSLLAAHVASDAKDDEGNTVLMAASESGSAEIAQLLLDAKADVNSKNSAGATALQLAAKNGQGEVVRLLRARGVGGALAAGGLEKALIDAAKKGEVDRVKSLVAAGAQLNWRTNEYGFEKPALHAAAEAGQTAAVAELVRLGVKLEEKVKVHYTSDTALHYAVFGGSPETVRALISLGANVNYVNERNETALSTAKGLAEVNYLQKRAKYEEIALILKQAGARESPAKE
jgi:ankyrin repeat protein